MSQTNLINSLVPGIPGLGSIALASIILLTAVSAVFFAFHRRQKQIVASGGLPFFGLPRGYSRCCGCFRRRCGIGLSAEPRRPAGCGCAVFGQSVESASRRSGLMNPIVGEGIVNAPLVFDVAVHLYLATDESTTAVTN